MVKFNGVNHLAMATGDMDTTIRFWRDLLGMRLVAGLGAPGYRHYFFQISPYDLIAFFEWPGVVPVAPKEHGRPVKGPFIFDHVSFGVETEDDLWELKDKLEAAGFDVSDVINHGFIHSIYAYRPKRHSHRVLSQRAGSRYPERASNERPGAVQSNLGGSRTQNRTMAEG